jgi:hypothetical protein
MMSREWIRYDGVCKDCGSKGEIGLWSDDWLRWGCEWKGFTGSARPTGFEFQTIRCEKCNSLNVSFVEVQNDVTALRGTHG